MTHYLLHKARRLIFALLLSALPTISAAISISGLSLEGESDLRQCSNHAPIFRWQLSDSTRDLSFLIQLHKQQGDRDSLIWDSDTITCSGNHFQYRSLGTLRNGETYRLSIQTLDNQNGSTDETSLTFTMNTPPTVPRVDPKKPPVAKGNFLRLPPITATDRQILDSDIAFQLQIYPDSLLTAPILDTLLPGSAAVHDQIIPLPPGTLRDNSFGFFRLRSYDGVEFSNWSSVRNFPNNVRNDPPRDFDLVAPLHGDTLSDTPVLSWQAAGDPDVVWGSDSLRYIIEYSTDSTFQYYVNTITVGGHRTEFALEKVVNHETYYWRVWAMDTEGATRRSRQTGRFTVNTGNRTPAAPKILAPLDKQVLTPTQYILWRFEDDPDSADRLSFTVIILDSITKETVFEEVLSDSLVTVSRFGLAEDFSIGYNNIAQYQLRRIDPTRLSDGHYYTVQVIASDNWGGSVSSARDNAVFRYDDNINTAPEAPQSGFFPYNTTVRHLRPTFGWDAAVDKDVNDRLKYRIQISRDSTFSNRRYIVQESRYSQTSLRLRTTLLENTTYYWRVRSIDLEEAISPWSSVMHFTVNQYNEAPDGIVTLAAPSDLSEIADSSWIKWLPVSDPDPEDSVHYIIEISTKTTFYSPLIRTRLSTPPHPADIRHPDTLAVRFSTIGANTKISDNHLYFWRILACDRFNVCGPAPDSPNRFIYNPINDPPFSVSRGFRPANGAIVNSRTPLLSWYSASDPDFSDLQMNLSYKIQIARDGLFQDEKLREYQTAPGDTSYNVSQPLAENQKYFYRIQTVDSHGATSGWSTINSFITNEFPEPPFPVSTGFIPKDSVIVTSSDPLITWLPTSDPDPGQYSRDLYYTLRYFRTAKPSKYFDIFSEKGVTSVQLAYLKEDHYYGYRVAAVDPDGLQSDWSDIHYFGVDAVPQYPTEFQLLSPRYYQDSVRTDFKFQWQASRDHDLGDKIQYTFYYSTDSSFSSNTFGAVVESEDTLIVEYQPAIPLEREKKYFWRVVATDMSGHQTWGSNSRDNPFVFTTIGYRKAPNLIPQQFVLYQNYPNPFNQATKIKYVVSELGPVEVTIYDILGQKVRSLADGRHQPGVYEVIWDGTDNSGAAVPGGMYICRMHARNFSSHKKVLLMK